jgi:hypothetical protein
MERESSRLRSLQSNDVFFDVTLHRTEIIDGIRAALGNFSDGTVFFPDY